MKVRTKLYHICIILTLLFISGIFLLCPSGSNAATEKKSLIFAGNDKFAPYSFFLNDTPAGYSVDLVRVLSSATNKDITIKLMSWEKCISGLREGTVDGLIGIPVYKKREMYIDYSAPVASIDHAIFVKATNHYVNSIESLGGTVVAVNKESLILNELLKDRRIKVLKTNSVPEALSRLKNREVSAVIAEKDVALYYI
ncbi:MAG: transporter substrate-binding domain-containing protein, partial [Candidatus Omnitrophica bacterium]|nr:transporter substrate-binding domain-containing protein [Candidatus Omnitrophota bacterium]